VKKNHKYGIWWAILSIAILMFYLSELVESSMYIDGVWYAVISRNMSQGIGSFWFPRFSETFFSDFHEHPPLMFGIQSWYFSIFGDSWWTERIYSLTQYAAIAGLIVFYWKRAFRLCPELSKLWFIPLLLWQVNLANYYYLSANLLESPLIIFNLITVLFLWKVGEGQKVLLNLLAAGFFLFLSFLTKGFVGFFPLAFLAIYYLVFRNSTFLIMMLRSTLLVLFVLGYFVILFVLQAESVDSLMNYLDVQVLASLKGERRLYYFRENRFFIIGQLFIVLFPMILVTVVNILFAKWSKASNLSLQKIFYTNEAKTSLVFFLTGLSASLPIMISPRQALPYLLPSIPFLSVSIGIIASFFFDKWWGKFIEKQKRMMPIFYSGIAIILFFSISFCISKYGESNQRDFAVINDARAIGKITAKQKIISSTEYNMYISGYLMRFNQVSIDTSNLEHSFLITTKEDEFSSPLFERVPLSTLKYDLYKKIVK